LGRGVDLRNGVALFLGEKLVEAFYAPIDDESYDCENDCRADQQYSIRRKNEHSFFPFGFEVIFPVSQRKEGTDSQNVPANTPSVKKFLGGFWEKKLDILEII